MTAWYISGERVREAGERFLPVRGRARLFSTLQDIMPELSYVAPTALLGREFPEHASGYYFLASTGRGIKYTLARYDATEPSNRKLMLDILQRKEYQKEDSFPLHERGWLERGEYLYWLEPVQ